MDRFSMAGGQFLLNDRPLFIHAGEFHYFRTPQDQWKHRLSLLKEAGFNTVAAYIPWLWHQLEEDLSDFDGHSHPMRNLEGFLDLAAEMGFYIIPRPGPYIMAETINEGIPPWVFRNYPGAAFVNQENTALNIASYLHPDFLACVEKWYREIFGVLAPRQITRGGKIIMIQLDNEMGMMQWVRNVFDTNPHTISRFADYITRAYGERLSERYPAGELPEFLREEILHPTMDNAEKVVADYRRFYREYLRDYANYLWSTAKSYGMEVPPVANIHGFGNGGKTFPIGLSQLIDVMRLDGMVSATDVYPLYIGDGNFHELVMVNEMTKALQNQDQALFSIEFQSGGCPDFGNGQTSFFDLHSRLCISTGMRAINHYLFFGGENHPILSPVKRHDWGPPVRPDGTVRPQYYRYPKLSKVLGCYGADLVRAQPKTVTTIGFILDYFMTEVNNAFTQEATNILTRQRDVILFDMIGKALAITHRPYRVVELASGALDPLQTPLCWLMIEKQCDAAVQQKLVDYARAGGKLILMGRMCVEDFNHNPCTLLRDALGITQIDSTLPYVSTDITVFDHADVPAAFVETYAGDFDEIFAATESGTPIGFVKTVGQGKVILFGAAVSATTLGDIDIVDRMATIMGCPRLFQVSSWVDVRLSEGENGSFAFINNYQDDPVETIVEMDRAALFGGNPLHLPARKGLILPIEWQVREGIRVHYLTSEVVEIFDDGAGVILKTEQPEFVTEMTLSGYSCENAALIEQMGEASRVRFAGKEGLIILRKMSA